LILLKYFEENFRVLLDKTVLELGAGLGLTSIGCKILGCKKMIATDLPEVIPLTASNALHNKQEIDCKVLDWYSPYTVQCDLIIISDVVWVSSLVKPLVNTLKVLLTPNNFAIMCYKLRSNIVHQGFIDELNSQAILIDLVAQIESHTIWKLSL
jgi:predicted nicotinamide N-methyase